MIETVTVKRVYEDRSPDDGNRVLVDRLWPRGIRRDEIPQGSWARDVAPSTELRDWFQHEPGKFDEFARRYRAELDENPEVDRLLTLEGRITLLTAVRDVEVSHATVLRDYLLGQMRA